MDRVWGAWTGPRLRPVFRNIQQKSSCSSCWTLTFSSASPSLTRSSCKTSSSVYGIRQGKIFLLVIVARSIFRKLNRDMCYITVRVCCAGRKYSIRNPKLAGKWRWPIEKQESVMWPFFLGEWSMTHIRLQCALTKQCHLWKPHYSRGSARIRRLRKSETTNY